MDTTTAAQGARATRLTVHSTTGTAFIDVTHRLEALVAAAGVRIGTLCVQTTHTTTAIVVNEHEPLLLTDFITVLERIAPCGRDYAHDEMSLRGAVPPDEPRNGHAHCRALVLPTSASVNICDGRLTLGRWQRIFLVELDGPRRRELSVVIHGGAEL
jgi:secondary thiamine-phosphate synthase enzyme